MRIILTSGKFHSGLLYLGFPFFVSLAVYYLTPRTDGANWLKRFWNNLRSSLIILLSLILMEGYVCVIFFFPMVRGCGEDVTITVAVAPSIGNLRCWHRTFTYENGAQQLVQTSKMISPAHGLLDVVGDKGQKMLATKCGCGSKATACFSKVRAIYCKRDLLPFQFPNS